MADSMIRTAFKGVCVGGTMLVPGVSGGSMAMLLGCYDRLISSVSSFTKNKKANFVYLSVFGMGGILGMMLFAGPVSALLEAYPMPMMYFFIGAVAGGIPMIYQKSGVKQMDWRLILYPLVGAAAVILLGALPAGILGGGQSGGGVVLFLAGLLAAVALVLPGISVSYMFLLLGMYGRIMEAIARVQILYLLPLGGGLLLGTVLTAKILETAMSRHPMPVYLVILGFILGSLGQVFPGFQDQPQILWCALGAAAGFAAIRLLSWHEQGSEV